MVDLNNYHPGRFKQLTSVSHWAATVCNSLQNAFARATGSVFSVRVLRLCFMSG